jgi:glutamate synthase (NADPH/NADH) small chain
MARLFKTTSAHDEGGERRFSTETLEFRGGDRVVELAIVDHSSDEVIAVPADLVLIAAGFVGPELDALGLFDARHLTTRDTLSVDADWRVASLGEEKAVFACGDAVRGQSLIVWAIAEGRSAAAAVDTYLTGGPSELPAPVAPYALSW